MLSDNGKAKRALLNVTLISIGTAFSGWYIATAILIAASIFINNRQIDWDQ